MELELWAREEQRVWRHLNTFGGYTWPLTPREIEGPMTVDEALDELDWLLGGGVSAELALQQITDHTPVALQKAAERRDRHMLARRIAQVAERDRQWESGAHKRKRTA